MHAFSITVRNTSALLNKVLVALIWRSPCAFFVYEDIITVSVSLQRRGSRADFENIENECMVGETTAFLKQCVCEL